MAEIRPTVVAGTLFDRTSPQLYDRQRFSCAPTAGLFIDRPDVYFPMPSLSVVRALDKSQDCRPPGSVGYGPGNACCGKQGRECLRPSYLGCLDYQCM